MEMTFSRYARYIPEASAEHERKLLKLFQQPDAATEQQEITKEITAPLFDPSRKKEKPAKTQVSRRRNKKMGQTRGLEPPSAGTTIQCLNHLATPAIDAEKQLRTALYKIIDSRLTLD